jgi:cytochrome c oxidase subunit 2
MDGSLLLASASSQNLSIFDPASPPAEYIRSLSVLVLVISAGIFIVVEGILIYCMARFRGRQPPHPTGTGTTAPDKEPPQVYGSRPIEIAWTVAPTLIVFVIVLVTTRTLWQVKISLPAPQSSDHAPLFVTVIGRQWWWEYHYDSYDGRKLGFITANELHIPASTDKDRPVYLTLKSADVAHSFWVPRLAGKTDLIPGRENHMWFQTDRPGLFLGQCAEYCGTQHAHMLLRVVVDEPEKFEKWLADQEQKAVEDPAVSDGKSVFLSQSCVTCHRVYGTAAKGTYAPDLTHLMSRDTIAAGMKENTEENLRKWVADPQQIKPGCLMPAFGLSKSDRDALVRYLLTLR